MSSKYKFYEFFAGGGMARAGLGGKWECVFANDFDDKKCATYRKNWGEETLVCDDIRNVSPEDLPNTADLVWSSFPCQDLSLAGGGAGLAGKRSGTFWPFVEILKDLRKENRAPAVIVLENVTGAITSNSGADFNLICETLGSLGYNFGAVVVDAKNFLPQSRARVFFVAIRRDLKMTNQSNLPNETWHPKSLMNAYSRLSGELKKSWVWWQMPKPKARKLNFSDIIEDNPKGVKWHSAEETKILLSMMSDVNLAKVETAKNSGVRMVGGLYKRTRVQHGIKVQRAEVRFDNIAGCLRTPTGGSSRQQILIVEGNRIRSRLISSRETARLMGLSEKYILPRSYNEAYHLTGDGVVVPVVSYLAKHILEPELKLNSSRKNVKV